MRIGQDYREHTIERFTDCRNKGRGLGGDQHGHDQGLVTTPVEILQVQRIVNRLGLCVRVVAQCTHLEFQDDDLVTDQEDVVSTLADARDDELKADDACGTRR